MTRMPGRNHSEKRRQERDSMEARMRLVWLGDKGEVCYAWGKCIDISRTGMQVESDSSFVSHLTRRNVSFRFSEPDCFGGSAVVRHTSQKGKRTVIGLEFAGGLEWVPEQEASADLLNLADALEQCTKRPILVT